SGSVRAHARLEWRRARARRGGTRRHRRAQPPVRIARRAPAVRLGRLVRLKILSRASDLARLQAMAGGRALTDRFADLEITYLTRVAAGDRDTTSPLSALPDKGAFTSDLSDALASGEADLVVHSWKDLPLEGRPGTMLAATLERADPRDVLLVRRDAL